MNSFYNDLSDVMVWLSDCIIELQKVLLSTNLRFRYILYFVFTLLILPFIFDVIFSFILSFRAKKLVIFNPFKPYDFKALSPFSFRSVKTDHFRSDVPKSFNSFTGYLVPKEKNIIYSTVNGRYEVKGLNSSFSNKLCSSVRSISYPYSFTRLSTNSLSVGFNGKYNGLIRSGLFFTNFNTGLTSKFNGFPSSKLSYSLFSSKFGSRLINISDYFSHPQFVPIRLSYFYPTKLALYFKKSEPKELELSEEEKFNMDVDKALYRMAVSNEAYKRMWNGDGYDDLVAQAFMKKVVNGEATVSYNKSDDKVDIIISEKVAHNRANFFWNRGRNLENEDKKEDKKVK